ELERGGGHFAGCGGSLRTAKYFNAATHLFLLCYSSLHGLHPRTKKSDRGRRCADTRSRRQRECAAADRGRRSVLRGGRAGPPVQFAVSPEEAWRTAASVGSRGGSGGFTGSGARNARQRKWKSF